jgi:predicted house-cleaning NTP pyrophosphatase (Maf/HAM1 superfamily)
MEQKKINTTLEEDQIMVERLFSKEALANYDKSASSVPKSYFETFPEKLQQRIANNKPQLFFLTPLGKMAIAAVFLVIVSSTFIFLNNSVSKKSIMVSISMQDISNDEIEAYIDANEWMAEIDWQSEAFKPDTEIEQFYKDSID